MPVATTTQKGLMSDDDKKKQINQLVSIAGDDLYKITSQVSTWHRVGTIVYHFNEKVVQMYMISIYNKSDVTSIFIRKCWGNYSDDTKFYKKDDIVYLSPDRSQSEKDTYYIISYEPTERIGKKTIVDETYTEVVPTT